MKENKLTKARNMIMDKVDCMLAAHPAMVKGVVAAGITATQIFNSVTVMASDGDGKAVFEVVAKWAGKIAIVMGLFMAIVGLIGFANARSDGNGQEEHKATGKLTAAVILVGTGAGMAALGNELAKYINFSI